MIIERIALMVKKLIIPFMCSCFLLIISINFNAITDYITKQIVSHQIVTLKNNIYSKKEGFLYVPISNAIIPYSYNDLLSVLFSIINSGTKKFTFYCPSEYKDCINDLEKISNDDIILTHINNFVHPYNSFSSFNTTIYETGEVVIKIEHLYNKKQINAINKKVNKIIKEQINEALSDYDKIKKIHDYIINTTKYDESAKEDGKIYNHSNIAYGVLFNNLATCNGYTDTMAIFLDKMGYINYKIATTPKEITYKSSGHVWNAVSVNDKWYHIDLTWDDPVGDDGQEYLLHEYFLVDNKGLLASDSGDVKLEEHNFLKNIYLEFNELTYSITS